MEMDNNQYNISDLRHFITRTTSNAPHFSLYGQQQQSLLPDHMTAQHHHLGLTSAPAAAQQQHHYGNEMVVLGRHMVPTAASAADVSNTTSIRHYHDHFNCDSNTATATTTASLGNNYDGGDGGAARWPRQETLTLLEVRSRLDHKFKEANQKGPLWDEVARIMGEEHGYQRSGKKCREKFENLYKYYKKTREGKAGRQDGKHYRFFRQLEALYGEHHHPNSTSDAPITENTPHYNTHGIPPQPSSLSLSISSDFETSSSDNDDLNDGSMESKKDKKRSWKGKIKDFIDFQMRKIMEKQETWLEKMMNTLESRENERIAREEEWRKQEVERVEREHKFWANERAWIEARDSALMSALDKLTNTNNNTTASGSHQWPEHEVTRLIQVRTSMESRFQQCGFSDEVLWEDIATKMAYFGYDRTPIVCKEKWDNINTYFRGKSSMIKAESKKKRKEDYGGIMQGNNHNNNHNEGGIYMNQLNGFNNNCEINNETRLQLNEGSSSPSSHNSNVNVNASNNVTNGVGNVMNDSCLRFFLGDGDSNNLGWESNYGLKLNNGGNQCA